MNTIDEAIDNILDEEDRIVDRLDEESVVEEKIDPFGKRYEDDD